MANQDLATELTEVARRFRQNPGLQAKGLIGLVTEVLGPTDWLRGPGDDAAAIGDEGSYTLAAGEAIWPPYVERDPFGAGIAAVLTNVNDVAAMGGRPLAIVDTVVGPEGLARTVLEGMRFASELYGVPVVGGHLTIRDGPPAVSAFVVGRATRLLASKYAEPGLRLLLACCVEGEMHRDFPFFSSLRSRGPRVATDLETLPAVAEAGLCVAAKDVSMAGILGSLAMLLEPTGCGAVVDLDRVPRPEHVPLVSWLEAFPSFGFLLCAPPDATVGCRSVFREQGLTCEEVGEVDGTGELRVRLGGREAVLLRRTGGSVTGLGDQAHRGWGKQG